MSKPNYTQTIVLVADGFEEEPISIIFTRLREAGLKVNLVGLRAKQVSGMHGLTIVPDLSLDRLLEGVGAISAVILPGGDGHLARLQRDPRVKILAELLSEVSLFISLGSAAEDLLVNILQANTAQPMMITLDENTSAVDFAQRVEQLLEEVY